MTNTFTQRVQLTNGVGEAYTPTVIGADGTVYAINDATLFAVGQTPSLSMSDASIVNSNSATSNLDFHRQPFIFHDATSDGSYRYLRWYRNRLALIIRPPRARSRSLRRLRRRRRHEHKRFPFRFYSPAQAEPNETFLADPVEPCKCHARTVPSYRHDHQSRIRPFRPLTCSTTTRSSTRTSKVSPVAQPTTKRSTRRRRPISPGTGTAGLPTSAPSPTGSTASWST